METIETDIKTLIDLEHCDWNGKLNSSFVWLQVSNLIKNHIPFMGRDAVGLNLVSVTARVSNFTPIGRTFEISSAESLKKYDGTDGKMYFLKGLYLDDKKNPSYFLSFLEYVKGQDLPNIRDFEVRKEDLRISS